MGPYEIGLGDGIGLGPPAPLPEDGANEVAVIAASNIVEVFVVDDSVLDLDVCLDHVDGVFFLLCFLGIQVAVVGIEDDVQAVEHFVQFVCVVIGVLVDLFAADVSVNVRAV